MKWRAGGCADTRKVPFSRKALLAFHTMFNTREGLMSNLMNRRLPSVLTITLAATLILASQPVFATETFLSGFDGDFSNTVDPNADWFLLDPNNMTSVFVTDPNDGVTQGTEAIQVTKSRFPPAALIAITSSELIPVVAANNILKMDVTVPSDVGFRFVEAALVAEDPNTGVFGDFFELGGGIDLDDVTTSGTVSWNYALDGHKDFFSTYTGEFQIRVLVFGNDFNSENTITTTIDNVRFVVPEPASAGLALLCMSAISVIRLRRRQ